MRRIDVLYDGALYSIGREDYDAVKAAITSAATGSATWITVNHGEGRPQPAELLIGPGIPIAILPITQDDDAPATSPSTPDR
jgi:hypothetical protein